MSTSRWLALIVVSAAIAAPRVAAAQASRTGPTFAIGGTTSPVILPDVAYDSLHSRYLVVSGNGFIEGHLLDANGARLNRIVVTAGSLAGGYAQTPRAAFSPDLNNGAGGYLVTWHETVGSIAQVRGKLLTADGGALTGDIVIATEATAGGTGSHWVMGAAIAYSTASREFLVTWMGGYFTVQDIRFNRINLSGALLQSPVAITSGVDWERDPSVAYNPAQNEFYITYSGYVDAGGFGYVSGQRIRSGTGELIGGPTRYIQSAATLIPHVEYNVQTGQYLVVWYNRTSGSAAFYGVSVRGSDGAVAGAVRVMSSRYFAYDALDFAYSRDTHDFLLVTHGAGQQEYEDAAVPINPDGTPYDNGFILTNTPDVRAVTAGDGNFNPRVASAANGRHLMVTSSKFAAVHGQFATSGRSSGGQPPPPPPPPGTQPYISLDVPVGGNVSSQFAVAGWAVDAGSPSGTGVDAVHVWAFSTANGAATFVGQANLGVSRPDVGALFQSSRFTSSGFGMTGTLPPGTYDINSYARSTLTGQFMAAVTRRITVLAPMSNPQMVIDIPVANQTVTQFFTISGWAVDLGAAVGSGVSGIHVHAFPVSGGASIFVGATTTGIPRPDVGAYFGNARFSPSGYALQANLPPGEYVLVAYGWSDLVRNFNNSAMVRIRVV